MNTEELLAKAKKPAADAMRLHPFYRGKIETTLKCTVHSFDDFAIWYTPGVAAPCKAIQADPELVYEYTNKWNTVAVVSDGTRVLGLGPRESFLRRCRQQSNDEGRARPD
mgnify:CR=1 FL=1